MACRKIPAADPACSSSISNLRIRTILNFARPLREGLITSAGHDDEGRMDRERTPLIVTDGVLQLKTGMNEQ